MAQDDSAHAQLVKALRKALTAKEAPLTEKRLAELIEEAKEEFRSRAQVRKERLDTLANSTAQQ